MNPQKQFLAYSTTLFGPTGSNFLCLFSHGRLLVHSLLFEGGCFLLHLLNHHFLLFLFLFGAVFAPVEEVWYQVATIHLKYFVLYFCVQSYFVMVRLIFPVFEIAEKDTAEHVFDNCTRFLFLGNCHLSLNGSVKFSVLLQSYIHVWSKGLSHDLMLLFLFVYHKGIETNPNHIVGVWLFELDSSHICLHHVSLVLNWIFPSLNNWAEDHYPWMSFYKNLLFEGIEICGEIKLVGVFSLQDFDSYCVFKVSIVYFPNVNGLPHLRILAFDDHLC